MLELTLVLIPIALVDSTSITPLALVPLITVLAGKRPYLTAFSFIIGLFLSYLVMAIGFLFGLSAVLMRLNTWAGHRWNNPEPVDFGLEILLGLVMLFFGLKIFEKRKTKSESRELQAGVTPVAAFGFACFLNVVGFPGALPYFAAADRIVQADLAPFEAVMAVVIYVGVFVMPLTALVLLRRVLGERMDGVMLAVKGFFENWGRKLVLILLILLGLALLADGALYFLRGEPIMPIGWPGGS